MGPSLRRRVNRVITKDYDRVSQVWDGTFVPATDTIRHAILDMAALHPGESVLDIGTGTGAAALLAGERVGERGRVLGIDMSPGMLAKARANAARAGATNVAFRRMDATALRLPRASFDVILSSFGTPEGLHDGEAVLHNWLGVLRPGGRLCFAENPGIMSFYKIWRRALEKHKVKIPGPALAARRRLWDNANGAFRRTPAIDGSQPKTVGRLMRAAGFRDVRVTHRRFIVPMDSTRVLLRLFLQWGGANEYAEMPPAVRASFREELRRSLNRYETPEGLRLPAQANLFFGRKTVRAR